MNMAANSDKMAVTDNQSTIPVQGSDSREDNDIKQNKPLSEGTLKKKSTFKITSVTKNPDAADISNDADHDVEHDSMDDLDETVESHTEDASSEIFDVSKQNDGGELASPMEEEMTDQVNPSANAKVERDMNSKERDRIEQGSHSTRFKVVKIETREPFKRGRWNCLDTLDYPAPEKSDTKLNVGDSNTGSVIYSNSVHQMDDSFKNPPKSMNVISNENKENFHPDSQSQIQQNSVPTSVVQNSIAQQTTQNYPVSNFQNNIGHSQPTPNMNTYVAQGQSSMQTSDKPQTTYIYGGPVPGQTPNAIQNMTNSDQKQFEQEHYGLNDKVLTLVDNKESSLQNHDLQENPSNMEAQGAILTPQSVAEVVGMMPSPQEEEDRSPGKLGGMNPLVPGGSRGSSTVAIDNKIEQAMDLVKSHLMYAVREEVEVLKEQIKELMDKNSQLEYENQILKNSASPETLAKISNLPPSSSS